MNILHLTPDFNYSDGRSYYVYLLLKYLKKNGHNVIFSSNGGDSFDRVRELEIPVYINKSLSNKTSFLKSKNYISGLIESNKIDLVHSHHRYYELLATAISNKKKFITVFTALSLVDKRFFVEYKSDKIIAVSNCVKKMLVNKFNVDENRIFLIPNFADSEEVIVNREFELFNRDKDQIVILSVGRFHKEKNFETLLLALSLLREFEIKLLLIGEGEDREKYKFIIKENSLDADLISPKRYLNEYFNTADMCVLSSVRDPLPGFMLQSGLFRKPFIGSKVDGIAEVITDGVNGLLFEKRNASELAEKIKMFITDKECGARCAENLQRMILQNYTEKTVIPEIEKLYDSLLN